MSIDAVKQADPPPSTQTFVGNGLARCVLSVSTPALGETTRNTMVESWLVRGLSGGALIGLSASLLLVLNGRITGVSGILNGLMRGSEWKELPGRASFVLGLLVAGAAALPIFGSAGAAPPIATAVVAGALVGVGTRLANGCTSGHGICGLSRLSARSLAATLVFIVAGALSVLATRGGGSP
jgi:uncharacterized membrane protein YedE/YeeE